MYDDYGLMGSLDSTEDGKLPVEKPGEINLNSKIFDDHCKT